MPGRAPQRFSDRRGGELVGPRARSVPLGALPTAVLTAETITASCMVHRSG